MASNYNSQPFAAEVLIAGGKKKLVRRRQTIEELLAGETDGDVR
jgi:diaminopimelate decarboxylase